MTFQIKQILVIVPYSEDIFEYKKRFNQYYGFKEDYSLTYIKELTIKDIPKAIAIRKIDFIMADNRVSEATINSYASFFRLKSNRISKFTEDFKNVVTLLGQIKND